MKLPYGLRLLVLALLATAPLAGCGARPTPSLEAQRAVLQQARRSPDQQAKLGAWHHLLGDAAAARAAFDAAGDSPRAALGRALLALDELDASAAHAEALRAAGSSDPLLARLALRLADASALELSAAQRAATQARAEGAEGDETDNDFKSLRVTLTGARSTVRVSFLPHLDLRRLILNPPALEGEVLQALDQTWALRPEGPAPDADGVVLTVWPLPEGVAWVDIEAEGPLVAWRDGKALSTPDLDHLPPGHTHLHAPGTGPLVVAWSSGKRPKARRWLLPPPAAAGLAPEVPEHARTPDWTAVALLAELALRDDDPESAAALLRDAPPAPGLLTLRARLARAESGRPDNLARDTARALWIEALEVAPARAHLALATLDLEVSEPAAALAHLVTAARLAPHAAAVHAAHARAALSLGRNAEAQTALDAALRLAPDPCGLVSLKAAVMDAQSVGPARLAVVPELVRCGQAVAAVERLLDAHQPEAALRILDTEGAKARPEKRARRLRARALVALGEPQAARALLDETADADDALLALDLDLAAAPQVPAEAVTAMHRLHPVSGAALELAAAWPALAPYGPRLLDVETAIAAYEASVPLAGPAVRVLDDSVLLFMADGHSLRHVSEVLAIRSREAAETYGEINLPSRARVVALYTRKADGRRIEAEETPEKDSITLRDLGVGDYVVAAWLEPGDNGYLYDRGLLSQRVFFQGVDLPIFHQRFEAYAPDEQPLTVYGTAGAPEPSSQRLVPPTPPVLPRSAPLAVQEPPPPAAATAGPTQGATSGAAEPQAPDSKDEPEDGPSPSTAGDEANAGAEQPLRDGSGEAGARVNDEPKAGADGATETPPTPASTARHGVQLEVRNQPLLPREPDSAPAALWLPSARVGRNIKRADDLAWYRDRLLGKRRRTARFDAWAHVQAGKGSQAQRVKRLARAVREAVDDQSGLIDEDVTRAVATGSGNRALTLSAALEAIGVPHTLILARPKVKVPTGPFEVVSDYSYPLLLVGGDLLDPGPERAAPGFFPATLAGGDTLLLWPPDAISGAMPGSADTELNRAALAKNQHPKRLDFAARHAKPCSDCPPGDVRSDLDRWQLPEGRSVPDTRTVKVTAHWGADGVLRGRIEDTLTGQESIVVGHHLSRLDPDQRPRLVERLLVAAVGGGRVLALEDPAKQDPDGPLVLRYTFEAQVGDDLWLGLFPVSPGRSHASLPSRRTALDITLPTYQQVDLRLTADRPFTTTCPQGQLREAGHNHELAPESDGTSLRIQSTLQVAGGLISPADYPAFARWARRVDDRERVRLKVCTGPCLRLEAPPEAAPFTDDPREDTDDPREDTDG